jgi:hypothetical protein
VNYEILMIYSSSFLFGSTTHKLWGAELKGSLAFVIFNAEREEKGWFNYLQRRATYKNK